jgi:hypothetical protein
VKNKVKYSNITLSGTVMHKGHEYLYFTIDEDQYFEWQRGSHTINTKAEPKYESQDLECFSLSYDKDRPSVRDAKSCILDYVNER